MTWTKSLGRNGFISWAFGGFVGLGGTLYWSAGKRYWKVYIHIIILRLTFGTRPLPNRLRALTHAENVPTETGTVAQGVGGRQGA